jgi:hypothetical protein
VRRMGTGGALRRVRIFSLMTVERPTFELKVSAAQTLRPRSIGCQWREPCEVVHECSLPSRPPAAIGCPSRIFGLQEPWKWKVQYFRHTS